MDSSNSSCILWVLNRWLMIFFVALSWGPPPLVLGCFTSVFNLGDSLSDTGNIFDTCLSNEPAHSCFPPYGETFFHRPTGRFSDGRLIIDFIAESLGIPLLQPYLDLGRERNISIEEFGKGVNFAVGGATALDASYFREMGVRVSTNYTLAVQLEWFKNAYSSASTSSSTAAASCRKILKSSLVVVGEIGGNDYNHPLYERHSFEEVKSFVPLVVQAIASTITELIKLGAETLMVPGNLPIGCSPVYLKIYGTSVQDSKNGCLNWLNQFSEYHNEQLQEELKRIRARHPHVHIVYADYYNSAMRFFNNPENFGLTNTLEVCLVRRHETFNKHTKYGLTISKTKAVCDDPSKYVSWDGFHLTEAAYKLIATALLQGPYTNPQFKTLCISQNATTNLLQLQ